MAGGFSNGFSNGFDTAATVITLTAANCTQAATSSTGAVSQVHTLAAANSTQASTSSSGAISVGAVHNLTASNCSQAATSSAGAITQIHRLTGANATQASTSTAVAISLGNVHNLAAANCTQAATAAGGAVSQLHILIAANCTQTILCSSGAITIPSAATEQTFFVDDLDYIYSDTSIDRRQATFNGKATGVFFDLEDQELFGGSARTSEGTIRFRSYEWPGLARGAVVDMGGANYTVREVRKINGVESIATLTKAL